MNKKEKQNKFKEERRNFLDRIKPLVSDESYNTVAAVLYNAENMSFGLAWEIKTLGKTLTVKEKKEHNPKIDLR